MNLITKAPSGEPLPVQFQLIKTVNNGVMIATNNKTMEISVNVDRLNRDLGGARATND